MGVLATALANLAAVTVPGVTSYAIGDTPDDLARVQLPALVIMPDAGGDSPGMQPAGFSAGIAQLTVRVAHVLLCGPVAVGLGRRGALPELVGLVDAYTAALAADPFLGGALAVALRFELRLGVVRYGGTEYYGATFLHAWVLQVG